MPELPEVETVRRELIKHLPLKVKLVFYSEHIDSILKTKEYSPKNRTIVAIERKGKFLDFNFKNGYHFISHFGMSGGWRVSNKRIIEKHTHIQFKCRKPLEDNKAIYLAYIDPRRFGNAYLVKKNNKLEQFGPDILSPEFTLKHFRISLKKYSDKEVKPILLNQSLFSGIGNYIASEMCAIAKIRPTRKIGNLKKKEIKLLYRAVFKVIEKSLNNNGLSFRGGYYDAKGAKGKAINSLIVYNKKVCGECKKKVKKIMQAGRATFFCFDCQS